MRKYFQANNLNLQRHIYRCLFCLLCLLLLKYGVAHTEEIGNLILINIPARSLELYQNSQLIGSWPVAVGAPSTATPQGGFRVISLEKNPTWYPPPDLKKKYPDPIPSGPNNPLGYRWIGIGGNYGIHGTNASWSIGEWVSNGCIRMYEENVEDLFASISINYPVQIIYERVTLSVDQDGYIILTINPDIYGLQSVDLAMVKKIISDSGLQWDGDQLPVTPLKFGPYPNLVHPQGIEFGLRNGKVWSVLINGQIAKVALNFTNGKIPLVSVCDLAKNCGKTAVIDVKQKTVTVDNNSQPIVLVDGQGYVKVLQINDLFGLYAYWDGVELHLDKLNEQDFLLK